ncbi:MAG: efflux RND transporter periplasmic adaptor subunit [Betaproteobacteria bacterium]|nr:efflux RND transporter periplasmic adaptor subunit [Betaproteobacteria bacterium]
MVIMRRRCAAVFALVIAAALVGGCGGDTDSAKRPSGPPAMLVTAMVVQPRDLEVIENVVGSLENVIDPSLGAEVAGRVVRVLAFTGKKVIKGELLAEIDAQDFEIQTRADSAEIGRLEALLTQAERLAERQQKLVAQGFISQNAADDAVAQRNALRESIAAAKARSEQTRRSLSKTRVTSPIDGEVEVQIVAVGDYVKVADPLFKLVGTQRLHAHLPLPESSNQVIRPGLKVRLSVPSSPDKGIDARIDEIRPTVNAQNRALDAIVKFDNDGSLRGGGSVNAKIVLAVRPKALTVPEQSVVLRPAGKVVYALVEQDGRLIAQQRPVQTGIRQDGYYEILQGLQAGDRVAVDGAGFLTNNAVVVLPKPAGKAADGKAPPVGKGDKAKN